MHPKGHCSKSVWPEFIWNLSITLQIRSGCWFCSTWRQHSILSIRWCSWVDCGWIRFRCSLKCSYWFKTYLVDGVQSVVIEKFLINASLLHFGVPHSSVQGLHPSRLNTCIGSLNSAYHFKFHIYADGTQIYFTVTDNTKDDTISRVGASER